jgi:TRAP-type mannitol/chloroaromatic compound transport system substrate-binding protein
LDDAERRRTLEEINRALVQQGVKLHPYPKDVMAAVLKAASELNDDEAVANPVFRRFYQSWTAFRYVQHQWYRTSPRPSSATSWRASACRSNDVVYHELSPCRARIRADGH